MKGLTARPERLFLVLALVIGLARVVLTPPFQTPDAHFHFLRAWQLTQGRIISPLKDDQGVPGDMFPARVVEDMYRALQGLRWDTEEGAAYKKGVSLKALAPLFRTRPGPGAETFHILNQQAMYFPLAYAPQILGIGLGRVLGSPALVQMYLARLMNLAAWLVLVGLAMRLTPVFKRVLLVLALTPMGVFLASSISLDVVTNGLIFLFTALVLRVRAGGRGLFLLLLLAALLALCKSIYILILPLCLIIPAGRFGGAARKWAYAALLMILAALPLSAWTRASAHLGHIPREKLRTETFERRVERIADFASGDPAGFVGLVARSLADKVPHHTLLSMGVRLGWSQASGVDYTKILAAAFLALLVVAALTDSDPKFFVRPRDRLVIALVLAATVTAVYLVMLLIWTPHGAAIIEGGRGRYIYPLLFPGLLVLYNRRMAWLAGPGAVRLGAWFLAAAQAWMLWALVSRYYSA
ncbi:MAG: DUF2142 domain-containing protein [Desulfovibrionaceae bacterium]|nr:DUF2142 domain-containing protein [Desulfovibrionaceae bacterium]